MSVALCIVIDASAIKKDFPIFHGRDLVYLDNAATTQKPESVIDAISDYYRNSYSNVHRGVYRISEEATSLYEHSRENIAAFAGMDDPSGLVFVRNTTEAINLLSYSLGAGLKAGDEILLTQMEHHSNIVPWQFLSGKGVNVQYARTTGDGLLDMDDLYSRINSHTRIISLCHVSNVLGTINPVKEICSYAADKGITTVVDGAQSVPHLPVSFEDTGCDFYAFSGHKMLGPSGIGCLCARKETLDRMQPFMGGGEMISSVSFKGADYAEAPARFEAGTPNVEGAIGLSAAVDYLNGIGMDEVRAHEKEMISYVLKLEEQAQIKGLRSFGPKDPAVRGAVYTFNIGDVPVFDIESAARSRSASIGMSIHPHDLASELDRRNIAIRSGHHCAMPLMGLLKQSATARASFYIYNGRKDAEILMESLEAAAGGESSGS